MNANARDLPAERPAAPRFRPPHAAVLRRRTMEGLARRGQYATLHRERNANVTAARLADLER